MRKLLILPMILLAGCSNEIVAFHAKTPSQCKVCRSKALDAENTTYKQAKKEMKETHEAERARIKHECDNVPAEVVNIPGPIATQPIPDAGEILPDSGTIKSINGQCKDGKCH